MEGDSNPVDRTGLKRKLDETESPPEQEQTVTTMSDSIDLNMPVVDSVLDASETPASHEMELQDADLMTQDIPVSIGDDVDVAVKPSSEPLVRDALQPSGLEELSTEVPTGNVLASESEEPEIFESSEPAQSSVTEPQSVEHTGLELPSLEASLPTASSVTPEIISTLTETKTVKTDSLSTESNITTKQEPNITTKHEENITTKHEENITTKHEENITTKHEENITTKHEENTTTKHEENNATKHEENITIKNEEIDIKHELPLSVGPSDEALISECEKLLEENREFEKSQMDHEQGNYQDDNDDQHSSDTVSVDSDTAKAQEDDFKDEPMDVDTAPKMEPSPIKQEDPLSTLASAALGIKTSSVIKTEIKDVKKKTATPWCDVGIFNTPACVVTGFYANQDTNEYGNVNSNTLPSLDDLPKLSLDPGTAYKFRVCAVNSCGRGPWSEVSAFRTCLPGFPGAPSSIKISKSPDGANISWHPPSSPSGNIIEYSVCLAIKKYNHRNEEIKPNPAALTFEKVYSGPSNHAIVSHAALSSAYVDTTNKPAIIFRIAAKNEKGYGPATQVRWLQDVYVSKK